MTAASRSRNLIRHRGCHGPSMIPAIGCLNPPQPHGNNGNAPSQTLSGRLHAAIAALREIDLPLQAEMLRDAALEVADIVRTLDADDEVVIAAMLQPLLEAGYSTCRAAAQRFGEEPLRLARALSQLGEFGLPADWTPGARARSGAGRSAAQDAAGGDRRCAAGRGAARASSCNECAPPRRLGHGAAAQARDRDPRGLCPARQSPRGVAGQMGTGGSGIPLSATGAIQAYRRRTEDAPVRA